MKKQRYLANFFIKKTKNDDDVSKSELNSPIQPEPQLSSSENVPKQSNQIDERAEENNNFEIQDNLPECWSMQQFTNFREKYDGLKILNKMLGCEYCEKYDFTKNKNSHVPKEWKGMQIQASGRNKEIQQASLRKKMKEHFSSKAHNVCVESFNQMKQNRMPALIDIMNEKYLMSTCRIFNTIYSLTKRCKPFSDIEDEVELQIKNGLDMGIGLHSRKTAVKIVEFIANDIRTEVFGKIIANNLKICLIIDEASTVSSKPVILVFLKIEDSFTPPTIFLTLLELDKQDAETIYYSVMNALNNNGFDNNYLKKNLVGFCSDGASVMLGRKSGVSARLSNEFPNIIIWHCLNHRLQLVLDDSINDIKQVNQFKIFIDKIYTIFHQSNKNQIELSQISKELEIDIIKIGRVFGPRWAACSLRSTIAVWRAYPALHNYFSSNEKYIGMTLRLENRFFLNDLSLMIDILNEISILSNALQARNMDIIKAEKLVIRTINFFEMLQKEKGVYENKIESLIASEAFKKIKFKENSKFIGLPRSKLLENIIMSLKKRLMDCDHLKSNCAQGIDKLEFINILEPSRWNIEEIIVPWKAAEDQLDGFNDFFKHQINANDYRDFVENVLKDTQNYMVPESVRKAHNIIRTIAVSSAEAERGFSKMNLICSDKRNRINVQNISNIMTISLIGLPLNEWDCVPFVKKWLRTNHSADDARVKKKHISDEDENQKAIWKYLK